MKINVSTIHSMQPTLTFRIGLHSFYKGLVVVLVVWRYGKSVTFTTKKIYDAYLADVAVRAKRIQKELRNESN